MGTKHMATPLLVPLSPRNTASRPNKTASTDAQAPLPLARAPSWQQTKAKAKKRFFSEI